MGSGRVRDRIGMGWKMGLERKLDRIGFQLGFDQDCNGKLQYWTGICVGSEQDPDGIGSGRYRNRSGMGAAGIENELGWDPDEIGSGLVGRSGWSRNGNRGKFWNHEWTERDLTRQN